jgi:hypothetical protein
MRHRIPAAALTAAAATLLLAGTALAGGWANAIMDDPPPDPPSAGEPMTIGFTLLQHGVTPVNDPAPTITVRNATSGEVLSVVATQEGASGHWVATIVFPSDGIWRYEVTHDLIVGMHGFNPVTIGAVAPAAPAATASTSAAAAQPLITVLLALLLATLAIGAAFVISRRRFGSVRAARG